MNVEATRLLWPVPWGWSLHHHPITGSTNDDAKRAALSGCADRTVFVADEQTHGRGRLGRSWVAPPGCCLLCSVVFRRPVSPIALVALCSVSIVEAIRASSDLTPRIKWPNDVMLGDRKVCGLLAEVVGHGDSRATIIGIGLNVNLDPANGGLPVTATSLSHECPQSWSRPELLTAILVQIDRHYALEPSATVALVWPKWEALLWRKHQQVRIDSAEEIIEGTVVGLASSGALRVREASGRVIEVSVGDVLAP